MSADLVVANSVHHASNGWLPKGWLHSASTKFDNRMYTQTQYVDFVLSMAISFQDPSGLD